MRGVVILLLNCGLVCGAKPVFHASVSSGWNEKPPIEFTVETNHKFVWQSGKTIFKGLIEPEALAQLIAHVKASKPGPAANDVGMLQITWREKASEPASKTFYFPAQMPASGLIQEIRAIAERDGKLHEAKLKH